MPFIIPWWFCYSVIIYLCAFAFITVPVVVSFLPAKNTRVKGLEIRKAHAIKSLIQGRNQQRRIHMVDYSNEV